MILGLTNTLLNRNGALRGSSYNAETLVMMAAAVTNGIPMPSPANLELISSTIDSLKAEGAWTVADRVTFWGNDSGSAGFGTINAVSPSTDLAELVNSVAFENKKGVEGDGVSAYIDTKYNPTTDAVNYGLDFASILLYQYKVATVGNDLFGIPSASFVRIKSANSSIQRINASGNLSNNAVFNQIGTIGLHKIDATNTDVQVNGVIFATTNVGPATLPNDDFSIFSAPTGVGFCNAGVTMEWVGAEVSSKGIAIHTIMQNYYTQLQLL
jgi:hypothetical protein